jgi:propionate CoA-transferase
MDKALFREESLGLRQRLSDIGIEDRISYTPETNTLFLDFSGMRVDSHQDIDRIREAVIGTLEPLGKKVVSIVNYDGFWVDPEVADEYLDLVRLVESNYYIKVSRYTTNGFMRIKLARGLEDRHISSDLVHSYAEARESLDSE